MSDRVFLSEQMPGTGIMFVNEKEWEAKIRADERAKAEAPARRLLKAAEAQLEWMDPAEQTEELRDAVKGLRDALGTDEGPA